MFPFPIFPSFATYTKKKKQARAWKPCCNIDPILGHVQKKRNSKKEILISDPETFLIQHDVYESPFLLSSALWCAHTKTPEFIVTYGAISTVIDNKV